MQVQEKPLAAGLSTRAADGLAIAAFVIAALVVYLPYALNGGWYYDDWDLYALFQDTAGGVGPDLSACADHIAGGRGAACVYHAIEYNVLGSYRTGYHLVAIGFLLLIAVLAYAILRRCGLRPAWAGLAGVLLILFPASDATRLWPVAAIGQYVVALVLGGQLIALVALGRAGLSAIVLHAVSALLLVLAMVTYEIAIPLVALGGLIYLAAYRDRRVLWRGLLDLGLVVAFLAWRLIISPPQKETGFVVERSLGQLVDRARVLLEGAWDTWKFVFAPGTLGTLALVGVGVAVAVLGATSPAFRKRALPWLVALGISGALFVLAALIYLTANDFYVPDLGSTFNRLNLPGSVPGTVAFVAILGLAFETIRHVLRSSAIAAVAVAVVAIGIGWHEAGISSGHKAAWERSWKLQSEALDGYRVALADVPETARIIGFDTPHWEAGFVPIFAASWDLRGAIDYMTEVDPPTAGMWTQDHVCAKTGVEAGGVLQVAYAEPTQPLYFVSPNRRIAVRVTDERTCARLLADWGVPPVWAPGIA